MLCWNGRSWLKTLPTGLVPKVSGTLPFGRGRLYTLAMWKNEAVLSFVTILLPRPTKVSASVIPGGGEGEQGEIMMRKGLFDSHHNYG